MSRRSIQQAQIWQERIRQWQASGTSLAQWSRESHLRYSQCLYWKLRFLGPGIKEPENAPKGFYEIETEALEDSGVSLELSDVQIHLSTEFDSSTLLKCLDLLQRRAC